MSAGEQKDVFSAALGETLQKDCSYDVVQSVHEQLRQRIAEHKESRDPQMLTLSAREMGDILQGSGVPEEVPGEAPQEAEESAPAEAAEGPPAEAEESAAVLNE